MWPDRNKLEAALTELLRGPTVKKKASGLASEIQKGRFFLGCEAE